MTRGLAKFLGWGLVLVACAGVDERGDHEGVASISSPPKVEATLAAMPHGGAARPEEIEARTDAAPEAVAVADDPEEPDPEVEIESEDDEYWVGPPEVIPECEAKLEAAGVEFSASRIPLHETKGGYFCGAEQIVRYSGGPGGIVWSSRPKVSCAVALAMAKLETIVQEEAERHFDRRVKRIQHMGTYNCREMANYPGWVSEHSYANAIDIKYFQLSGGTKISVLDHYAKSDTEPKTAKAKFLRAVARRLYDERVFAVVLTPSFDRAHRNHFHLDMARYRVDGI